MTRPDVAGRGQTCRFAEVILAGCGPTWPCTCGRWLPVWLPKDLVSNANVRTIETPDSSIKCVWRSTDRSPEWRPHEGASLLSLLASRGGGDRAVSAKHPQP